ncbi:MAG: DUF2461 domain-containing protein, partial [Eudoraea sp.]|nr:DUF2461 domain-containing protein [Eudoraea sp.]
AIDYNGDELVTIINHSDFRKRFGGLYEDTRLTKAPKGFDPVHPHLELLKNKTFAVACNISRDQILDPDFKDLVVQVYQEMLPFRRYLNEAITV